MLEHLIQQYGYIAVFIGTFLEGETVLVLGGFAAHRGFLDIWLVVLAAFLGSLAGDQTWFFIGRSKGMPFIERRPVWKARSERVLDLLHRYHVPLLIGFRFLYGLRNPIPFVVGASGFSPWRFLIFNAIGALIWSVVIGFAGFLFGEAVELVIDDVKRYERWGLLAIALIGVAVWIAIALRRRARRLADAAAGTGDGASRG